jgi:hypothetical protein
MQPEKKLTLDQTLLVLQTQVEVMRFRTRRLVAILEKEHLPELLDVLEAEYQKNFGRPFKDD